jgi:osmotically inducible lipoprotein OsmB
LEISGTVVLKIGADMKKIIKRIVLSVAGLGIAGTGVGCSTNAGTGALIGGASGAGLGAIIGNNSHGRGGSGAVIGGAVGAVAGGLIGNEMDKNEHHDRHYDDRGYYERDGYYDRHASRGDYYESRRYEDSVGRY